MAVVPVSLSTLCGFYDYSATSTIFSVAKKQEFSEWIEQYDIDPDVLFISGENQVFINKLSQLVLGSASFKNNHLRFQTDDDALLFKMTWL